MLLVLKYLPLVVEVVALVVLVVVVIIVGAIVVVMIAVVFVLDFGVAFESVLIQALNSLQVSTPSYHYLTLVLELFAV